MKQKFNIFFIVLLWSLFPFDVVKADTFTWRPISPYNESAQYTATVNIDKSAYNPGEAIVTTGNLTIATCVNRYYWSALMVNLDGSNGRNIVYDAMIYQMSLYGSTVYSVPSTPGTHYVNFGVAFWSAGGSYWIYSPWHSIPFSVLGPPAVNGSCGISHGTTLTSTPNTGLCNSGISSGITSNNNSWSWVCDGTDGGSPSPTCVANKTCTAAVNKKYTERDFSLLESATSNLCHSGTFKNKVVDSVSKKILWQCEEGLTASLSCETALVKPSVEVKIKKVTPTP